MPGSFQVTPDELIDSGQQLKAIAEDLRFAHDRVKDLRSKELGSKRIDSALNSFADHWNFGMNTMVSKVDMTGEALLSAGRQYAGVDAAVAAGAGAGS
ncbi:MAG: hypothetical protein QOE80_1170 [Actinomycetota bacterium]|jgi:hypothetical protein|nr:hypothetical protein [Actinomycetota bacterium]MDQ1515340.1 hypothetical protein [Actinomycetota bacterium]